MNPFEMVILIVLIVTVGRVIQTLLGGGRMSRRERRAMTFGNTNASSEEAARLRAEVTRLNDRIQVLERLATDPAKRLSDEIEELKRK